eukprot:1649610-Rhodomonas_salina.2
MAWSVAKPGQKCHGCFRSITTLLYRTSGVAYRCACHHWSPSAVTNLQIGTACQAGPFLSGSEQHSKHDQTSASSMQVPARPSDDLPVAVAGLGPLQHENHRVHVGVIAGSEVEASHIPPFVALKLVGPVRLWQVIA